MATNIRKKTGYGLKSNPIQGLALEPIISNRIPTTRDRGEIGQVWIYQDSTNTDNVYTLTSIVNNISYWTNMGGGSGQFDAVTVNPGNLTVTAGDAVITAGDVNITAGDLTLGAGDLTITGLATDGLVTSTAGVLGTAAATNGEIYIGSTGSAPVLATITAGAGITVTNAPGSITIANPGATGTTMTCTDANVVSPDGAGNTDVIGYDANITTDGATANTVKIRLADNVTSVGKLTSSVGFDVLTGATSINSDTNAASAIRLHTNGGVNETINIWNEQGSSTNAIYVHADAGGITLETGVAGADAITIDTTSNNGGLDFNIGASGFNIGIANGPMVITSGTGNISIGADATDHDIEIGDAAGVNAMQLISGTGHTVMTSTGNITLDCAGVLELNSSAGIISIGNDNVAQNINLGTGAAARTITIGNATGASSVIINSGTGNLDLGVNATDHSTRMGSTNGVSATTIQSGTNAMTFTAGGVFDVNAVGNVTIDSNGGTIGIGVDANAYNINLGTGAAERIVTIGNNSSASSVVLNVGTGNLDLGVNATSHLTRVGSTSGTSALTLQSASGDFTITAGGNLPATVTGNLSHTVTGNITDTFAAYTATSSADAAQAIYLHTNGGTSETLELVNTQGTDTAAVKLTATAGGIAITAATAKGISIDSTGSTSIVHDTGTAAAAAITLNKRNGVVTLTGRTTASGATQRYTITNSVCQATSGLYVTVANKSAGNDCKITMEACTPAAGSFTVDTKNNGSQALDSDVIITFTIVN